MSGPSHCVMPSAASDADAQELGLDHQDLTDCLVVLGVGQVDDLLRMGTGLP